MLDPPFIAFRDVIDFELIQLLRRLSDDLQKEDASFGKDRVVNEQVRKAEVGFFPLEHWTAGLFFHFGVLANGQAWRFDLRGVGAVQATQYSERGHNDWHMDTGSPAVEGLHRKLTVVVPLSDSSEHEGGHLELRFADGRAHRIEESIKPGCVVVFPAYMPHRVAPVSRGVRRSIVAWLIGPSFR